MDIKILTEAADRSLARRMENGGGKSDADLKREIRDVLTDFSRRMELSEEEILTVEENLYNSRRRMGIIQPFLDDETVNEIMINGTDGIFLEKQGEIRQTEERFPGRDSIYNTVQNILSKVNRTVNESNPIQDARLPDGSRINIILAPVAINGPAVTIRKFREKPFTLENMRDNGTLSGEEADFLKKAVEKKMNILVSGGTSTGKTTFLNMLCSLAGKNERIITLEDSAELSLPQPDVVRLETRDNNGEGKGEITMRMLIKATLRMRPDRIIVGEVRDESALDMLSALNTGHEGSMSTVHSNSAENAVTRLETLALWEGHTGKETVDRMISSGIDIIVHLKRDGEMHRFAEEISEVGQENGVLTVRKLFYLGRKTGDLKLKEKKFRGDRRCY